MAYVVPNMKLIPQAMGMSCWYASVQMLISWKEEQRQASLADLIPPDLDAQCVCDPRCEHGHHESCDHRNGEKDRLKVRSARLRDARHDRRVASELWPSLGQRKDAYRCDRGYQERCRCYDAIDLRSVAGQSRKDRMEKLYDMV